MSQEGSFYLWYWWCIDAYLRPFISIRYWNRCSEGCESALRFTANFFDLTRWRFLRPSRKSSTLSAISVDRRKRSYCRRLWGPRFLQRGFHCSQWVLLTYRSRPLFSWRARLSTSLFPWLLFELAAKADGTSILISARWAKSAQVLSRSSCKAKQAFDSAILHMKPSLVDSFVREWSSGKLSPFSQPSSSRQSFYEFQACLARSLRLSYWICSSHTHLS